jgi:uncharacterized protein (UPF0333 family)
MVSNTNQLKHRQFALKLLFVAVIVAIVFTVWYLSEKGNRAEENSSAPTVQNMGQPET